MIVVADAGPLIYLGAIGRLELLPALYERVVVPRLVFDEVVVAGDGLPGSAEVAAATWIDVTDTEVSGSVFQALREELDPGESAALAHAVEARADLVLVDDRRARLAAARLGLTTRGTVGVLIEGKRRGKLGEVGPLLDELLRAGIWLSPEVLRVVLDQAGEGTG